jgi:hypothetical protein
LKPDIHKRVRFVPGASKRGEGRTGCAQSMPCLNHGGFLAKAKHLRTAVRHCKPALPEARTQGRRPGAKHGKACPPPWAMLVSQQPSLRSEGDLHNSCPSFSGPSPQPHRTRELGPVIGPDGPSRSGCHGPGTLPHPAPMRVKMRLHRPSLQDSRHHSPHRRPRLRCSPKRVGIGVLRIT